MNDFCGVTEISAPSHLLDGDAHIELLHCALTRRALRARAIIPNGGVPEWTRPVPGECRRDRAPEELRSRWVFGRRARYSSRDGYIGV
jgi:hypothetical protein